MIQSILTSYLFQKSKVTQLLFWNTLQKKKKNKKKIKTASNSNKASSSKKKLTKSLKAAVVEKWQLTNLAKYNADDWSVVDVDKTTNLVQSMNCSL